MSEDTGNGARQTQVATKATKSSPQAKDLELDWDNGKQVGVAQLIGDTLVVACLFKGRTAILMMTSNPDGSLAGKWSRRTDRGQKGTETWTKA